MKNRFFSLILVGLIALTFGTAGILTANDCAAVVDVADVIMIDNKDGYERARQGPVELTHKLHAEDYEVSCRECHHVYENGENVWQEGDHVQKCYECHDHNEDRNGAMRLQNAFHTNCQGCHREVAQQGFENAPTRRCNDCHQR